MKIDNKMSLEDLASVVSTALENAGVDAVLTGGGAVSIYSNNEYQSYDLDFITTRNISEVTEALQPLGFVRNVGDRYFTHSATEFAIEFPTGPLSFGETIVPLDETSILKVPLGIIRIVTPTQIIMDRMAAYIHWNDNQSREQAISVVQSNEIDWKLLYEWAEKEGASLSIIDRLKELG
ncbi:MAG: hypothetical protein FWC86_01835 [Coriobacteriia bacterium]|nr:hypothetical protein [Coriobacteriia bacterium]